MLEKLEEIKKILPKLLLEKLLDNQLHTMYIDYHKPFVKRIWFQHDDIRVFLHKIEVCESSSDALYHPHKWDSAMEILDGTYEMGIGYSQTNEIPKTCCKIILSSGAKYEMTEPDGWHYVRPIKPCYTLMVTGRLNNRVMPIEPNKEFRKLDYDEICDILDDYELDSEFYDILESKFYGNKTGNVSDFYGL